MPPCLYIVSPKATGQSHVSGSIDDCTPLLPNGQRLDFFEVPLAGGFLPIKTDLYVPDSVPLAFTRTYLPLSSWADQFHVYMPNVYDIFMSGSRFPYTYQCWSFPDAQQAYYDRVSQGIGYTDAVFAPRFASGIFTNSRVNWNGWGWDWSFADGMTYLSPEAYNAKHPQQGSIIGVFNSRGEEAKVSRDADGTLTRIDSPHGGWIRFDYSGKHLVRATSSLKETVDYTYDANDRVVSAREPGGSLVTYSYDSADRIVAVADPAEDESIAVQYGDEGEVTALTANGLIYRLAYVAGRGVTITESTGRSTRVVIQAVNPFAYSIR